MLLNWLDLKSNGVRIRKIPFKKGLNLILDKSDNVQGGNSIGKSTLGRVVDYMFLAKADDIYLDKEFKRPNPFVYSFLEKNEITVDLAFTSRSGKEVVFSRNLPVGDEELVFQVSGEAVSAQEYVQTLSSLVFGITGLKPSIRNVAPKFVRNSHEKMQNTLKFLDLRTSDSVYNHVFPFLFGFTKMELITEKATLDKTIGNLKKKLVAYRFPHNEASLKRMVKPLAKEISDLQAKFSTLNVVGEASKDIQRLVDLQSQISALSVEVSKKKLILEAQAGSIKELESQMVSFSAKEVEEVYKFALLSLPKLNKSFDDVVRFHNSLIDTKLAFIHDISESLSSDIRDLESRIITMEKSENAILDRIKQPDVMLTLTELQKQISSLSERKGEIEGRVKAIEELKSEIQSKEESLDNIKKQLVGSQSILDTNIELFNELLGRYSKTLYNETYIFSLDFNHENGKCEYLIDSIAPNPEGGKKKGEISAFDLAYIEFVKLAKLKRPTFVFHDSIEDVDHVQISKIFEIANAVEGQYIVSMLRDKLVGIPEELIDECTILELSTDDKFFRV